MFNTEKPSLDALPSSAQLMRSTLLAGAAAIAILVTIVLPAEYAIDPTGIGRMLGLRDMGEIKRQLADEAEADRAVEGQEGASLLKDLLGVFVGTAQAQEAPQWQDQTTFTLAPGQSHEWKLVMETGAKAEYAMTVLGGRVNFDLHGHGGGQSITYEKGRGSTGQIGQFEAAFPGEHGWFWRNRDTSDVTITVQLRGDYSAIAD